MDPDVTVDIEGAEDEPAEAAATVPKSADTALKIPEQDAVVHHITRHPHHHHDTGSRIGARGAVGPTVAVERNQIERKSNNFIVATDGTTSPATASATTTEEQQLLPLEHVLHDGSRSDGRLLPASETAAARSSTKPSGTTPPAAAQWPTGTPPAAKTTAGGEIPLIDHRVLSSEKIPTAIAGGVGADVGTTADATHRPTSNKHFRPASLQPGSSSPISRSSASKEGRSCGANREDGSSTEGNQVDINADTEEGQDMGGDGGSDGRVSNDLPAQLSRLWGASPPNRAEELAVVRDMLGHREELDGILSKLMATKVKR